MQSIVLVFREHPELAIFLVLACGFLIGRVRIGSFTVGPMLGCLFAGMIIGQMDIAVSPVVKAVFFDLFLFATGYKVGPQFFYGLKKDALPQLALTVIICTSCLLTAFFTAKIMGFDVGTAAGLMAGAFTESTVIGTAGEAIMNLPLEEAEKQRLVNAIPVAYAVTYLVGTTALVWFLSTIAPKILRINLVEESRALADQYRGTNPAGTDLNSAYQEWSIRTFQINEGPWKGKTIAQAEQSFPGIRIIIHRVRHLGVVSDATDDYTIQDGDTLSVAARRTFMLDQLKVVGAEVDDKELLDFPMGEMEIIVSASSVAGKTLAEIAAAYGDGIMLHRLVRGGQDLPFAPGTVLQMGDLLYVSGRQADLDKAVKMLGFTEIKEDYTDILFVSLGIVLGGLAGILSVKISGILITLSASGGALVAGLVFGWLHSRKPAFGKIPHAALWIFDTLGLAVFLGIVGLGAGPTIVEGIRQTGWTIIPAGLVVAVLPHIIGLLAGRYLLRMHPVILLGAQTGAGTTTTGLKAVQDAAQSKLPVLGYTIPYALGNILLTAWGPVLVSLMT